MQMSMFDGEEQFKITKPIRLIELFGGYGSQALSLKYLGVDFEHWKLSEWAYKSIQAYKDLHFGEDNTDYSADMTNEEVFSALYKYGISANYNEPMTYEQIKRLGESKARTIYNNIQATHDIGSICNIAAKDLQITDTDKYCYIMTYSFPCQDLSSAGKGLGMGKDSGTRSGLLWEVERLLKECIELPQVLIMENVPEVIGSKNIKHFADWIAFLDNLGYKSKWEVINATDFNMPQNRERCFMISVLGNYYFEFPTKIGCKLRLKDLLEQNVDESYYLNNSIIEYFYKHTEEAKEKGNGFRFTPTDGDCIGRTINTRDGSRMDDNFIDEDALGVRVGMSKDFTRPPLKGVSRALMTDGREAVIESKCECVGLLGGRFENYHDCIRRVYSTENASPTLTTCGGGNTEPKILCLDEQNRTIKDDKCIGTLTTDGSSPKHNNRVIEALPEKNYQIRKLTERECFRLMGVKDEDFDKIKVNQSKSSLYHLAGDSIVTNVLMALFNQML